MRRTLFLSTVAAFFVGLITGWLLLESYYPRPTADHTNNQLAIQACLQDRGVPIFSSVSSGSESMMTHCDHHY